MSPEEKFENKVWEVLQKIKEEILFNDSKKIKWKESKYNPGLKSFSFDKGEEVILKKLQVMNAIEMREAIGVLAKLPGLNDPNYSSDEIVSLHKNGGIDTQYLYLKILEPKFSEIYNKYNKSQIKADEVKDNPIKNKRSYTRERRRNWFSMDNPIVYILVLIILGIISYLSFEYNWPILFES